MSPRASPLKRARALILAPSAAHLNELLRVAQLLRASERYTPVIALEMNLDAFEVCARRCAAAGSAFVDYTRPDSWVLEDERYEPVLVRPRLRPSIELLSECAPGAVEWPVWFTHFDVVAQGVRLARHALEFFRPDVIVVPEETVGYRFPILIKIGWRCGIASLVVPYTISSQSEAAETFLKHIRLREDYSVQPWVNRIVALLFPDWVHRYKGTPLLRMPPAAILAHWWQASAPPRPWIYNAGYAAAIAAESPHMAELYRTSGIAPKKIRVTGTLADDAIHAISVDKDTFRRSFAKEAGLKIQPFQRLVVIAIPPDLVTRKTEFCNHSEMMRAFAHVALGARDVAVLFSLHPTLNTDEVATIVESDRARVSHRNIAELVAVADLFIACASATIRMAISSGVPVVNYDAYGFHYDDYKGVAGVTTVSDHRSFKDAVELLLSDPSAYAGARDAIARSRGDWGLRDGRNGQRMLELVDELVRTGTRHSKPERAGSRPLPRRGIERLVPGVELALRLADHVIRSTRELSDRVTEWKGSWRLPRLELPPWPNWGWVADEYERILRFARRGLESARYRGVFAFVKRVIPAILRRLKRS